MASNKSETSRSAPGRRAFLTGAAVAGAALAGAPAMSASAQPQGQSGDIRLGRLRIHVARPSRATGAGILLHPRVAGLEPRMRAYARGFADMGITAVVWDPYDGEDVQGDTMVLLARSKKLTDTAVVADLRTIVDYMEATLGLTSIGAIGWCLGGRTVLLQAGLEPRLKAVSAYHPTIYSPTPVDLGAGALISKADFPGQTLDEFALAARIGCPVQIVRPGHDLCQPAEYERLRERLYARRAATLLDFYPEAEHGFPYQLSKPANVAANALAWPSTEAFFKSQLL